jgi:type I restriction enzyme S subunit
MASEWKEIELAEVMDIKHGFAFPGENIRDEPSGDILLTPGNFAIGGGFKGDKFKFFDGDVPEEYVLNEGDLIVTMTDLSKQSDTLGYPAFVPKSQGPRFLHNQRLGKVLIKDNAELDKRFLFYVLRSADYRNEVLASSTGTAVKHTSPGRILKHKALIPSLQEQEAISVVLGKLDDKIELNRKMNETLEAMARALFKSWFVDFAPVRAKAEGRDTGLPAHIAVLFPDSFEDSEIGEIPKGWNVRTLYEIAEFTNGAAYKDMYFSQDNSGLPVIKIAELKSGVTGTTRFTTTNLGDKYRIETKEILFSWSGNPDTSIDTFIWDGGPAWLNQHIFRVRENGKATRAWIFSQLKALRPVFAELARNKQTTGLGHVTVADMKRLMICESSHEIAVAFDKYALPLMEQIISNQLQIRNLTSLRDLLLPKLVNGEIRLGQNEERA